MPQKQTSIYRRGIRAVQHQAYKMGTQAVKGAIKGYVVNRVKSVFTKPKTKKKKSYALREGHGSLSHVSYKYGKKPRYTLGTVKRIVKANETKLVYGMRALTRFGGTSGYYGLINGQTAAGSSLAVPMWMFSVTSSPNDISGTTTQPSTGYQAIFANETATAGSMTFYNTATPNLAIENVPTNSTVSNLPLGSSMLRWVQAKFMFYCPTTQPTKINIMMVRFKRHELVPAIVAPGGNTTKTDDFSIAYYQSFLKKYMMNPIEVSNPNTDRFIQVLHSESFVLNPKESTEPTNTVFKQVDIFKWFNKKLTYNWDDSDKMSLTSTTDFQVNTAQNRTDVKPTSRIFIIVRALSGYKSTSQLLDSTIQPSFDLSLRTCHAQFV